jgi:hypothetical protein
MPGNQRAHVAGRSPMMQNLFPKEEQSTPVWPKTCKVELNAGLMRLRYRHPSIAAKQALRFSVRFEGHEATSSATKKTVIMRNDESSLKLRELRQ